MNSLFWIKIFGECSRYNPIPLLDPVILEMVLLLTTAGSSGMNLLRAKCMTLVTSECMNELPDISAPEVLSTVIAEF